MIPKSILRDENHLYGIGMKYCNKNQKTKPESNMLNFLPKMPSEISLIMLFQCFYYACNILLN